MKHKMIMAVIAFLLASGGYGGYKIIKATDEKAYEAALHKVERVVDGDTLILSDENRVRLLGVDAPERGACYYGESKEYLVDLLEGKDIRIEKGLTAKDDYGRLLRWVILPSPEKDEDNILVNEKILETGHALRLSYSDESVDDNRYRDILVTAEKEAKNKELGIWSECEVEDPKENTSALREIDTGPTDPNCTIKGNISEKGYGRNYFFDYCPNYNRIKIDTRKGESYFCNVEEAEEAGFVMSESCGNTF
ncbi:MAG: hypothetical protein COV70_04440 [Parcubacteria group bacterium CG11_big_fil_rev_8_21_14_0_20_39_22]|nr:MAG: hypothetical protein COV70_04440 [Parcubacteria group bacterium CG11_big_fil_rev_8_21_14_0_20_39_22]